MYPDTDPLVSEESGLHIVIVGPAYVDRVWHVSGALGGTGGPRADHSLTVDRFTTPDASGVALQVLTPGGDRLQIVGPADESAREILTREPRMFPGPGVAATDARVRLLDCHLQLGGMAAGYALALGGCLVTPLGEDPTGQVLLRMLDEAGVCYSACTAAGASTDTTELILSDTAEKLAIGLRDASGRVGARTLLAQARPADLTLVAGLPNATAAGVLADADGWTVFAPSLRNASEPGFAGAASQAAMLTLNEREWTAAGCPAHLVNACDVIVVTRGPAGAMALTRHGRSEVPALARHDIRDTNRAGEAFAAGFIAWMLEIAGIKGLADAMADVGTMAGALRAGTVMAWLQLGTDRTAFAARKEWLDTLRGPANRMGRLRNPET